MNTLNTRLLSAMLTCLTLSFCQSAIAQDLRNDTKGCPVDKPCFNAAYQSGNKVIFQFTGVGDWDLYNVRYKVAGGEKQVENRSGHFTFNNIKPNRVYRLSVQGCNTHFLGRSTCSDWVQESVSTK
jgi:hypothetical protein